VEVIRRCEKGNKKEMMYRKKKNIRDREREIENPP
jgi:hypothetical protein